MPHKVKRPFDFLLASLVLILSLPVWGILALLIKLVDGGPVFYRQKRWGKEKKEIWIPKFRTMIVGADKDNRQAGKNDLRITRMGRFLRATGLDELPQVLSIWKGDMSWVGPRALPINEVQNTEDKIADVAIAGFEMRTLVKPGLTGLAQVYAPRDVSRKRKFKYDAFYVKHQNFWLDLKLILASVLITLTGSWEETDRKFAVIARILSVFLILLWFAVTAVAAESVKELELRQEILKRDGTIADMQGEYSNLLNEFSRREKQRVRDAMNTLQQEIERKRKEAKDGNP